MWSPGSTARSGWSAGNRSNSQWPLRTPVSDGEVYIRQIRLDHLPQSALRNARDAMSGSPKLEAYSNMLEVLSEMRLDKQVEARGQPSKALAGRAATAQDLRTKHSTGTRSIAAKRNSNEEKGFTSPRTAQDTLDSILQGSARNLMTDMHMGQDGVDDPLDQAAYATNQLQRALAWQSIGRTGTASSCPDLAKAKLSHQRGPPKWLSFDPRHPPVGSAKRESGPIGEVAHGMSGSIAIGPRPRRRRLTPPAPMPRYGGLAQSIKNYQ
mmetsp:Transcript_615/g.1259  ORF Transcript_615/g.1259 Transcript_615/m.1259 type:complete len:267 (-) Transcript_615:49-849(-)